MRATIHMIDSSRKTLDVAQAQCGTELRRWLREHMVDTSQVDVIIPEHHSWIIYPEEIACGDFWYENHRPGSTRFSETVYSQDMVARRANLYARVEAKRAGIPFSKLN